MAKTTPATPVAPTAPAVATLPDTPATPVAPTAPAEPVEELPRKIDVIHKASQQKFEVSKDYYLRNKAAFELCR